MIDKLSLRCEFKTLRDLGNFSHTNLVYPVFELYQLEIPLEVSLDKDSEIINVRHSWERIPSSFHGLAFKVFDFRTAKNPMFFVEIKASPAKLMYGHNLYGSSDIRECAMFMIDILVKAYPALMEHLNESSWSLVDMDITFFSRADSNTEAVQFINALSNVSYGQTKSRTGYNGTAYFGKKNSRLKKIKVYAKHAETLEVLKKNPNLSEIIDSNLLEWAQGMIRWEVSLFYRFFARQGINTTLTEIFRTGVLSKEKLIELWINSTKDLFKSLEGREMTIIDDGEVKQLLRAKFAKIGKSGKISYAQADAAFMTYEYLKMKGWITTKESMAHNTFYRHTKMLTEAGLSRAYLQNLEGSVKSNVIPFLRFIGVDFGAQLPQGITETETGSLLGIPVKALK